MQIKLFISMAIAAAVASNAFALQITKGKLISHKEWTTGGAIAASLPGTKTLASIMRDKNIMRPGRTHTSYFLQAEAAPVSGHVGERIPVSNDAYIYAYNDTNEIKHYQYNFNICAIKTEKITECVNSGDVVELQPGGSFHNFGQPVLKVKFDKAGTYVADAASTLYEGNTKTSVSVSLADITVS